jgi:AAHS family 4-hydroxybenzoate transporter-like MFS transporter
MDRYGPYRVMSLLFVAGAMFSIFLGLSLSWTAAALIATASFGSGFCTSGVQKGGNALSIYFYPTALRSTGLGWGLGIGRIGAIVGPLAVGYLLTSGWSSTAVFCAMAVPMLVGAAAIVSMGRAYGRGIAAERTSEIAARPEPAAHPVKA